MSSYNDCLSPSEQIEIEQAIALLEDEDWFLARTKGSHRQFKHLAIAKLVTMPGKPSKALLFNRALATTTRVQAFCLITQAMGRGAYLWLALAGVGV